MSFPIFFTDDQLAHRPAHHLYMGQQMPSPEAPDRASALMRAAIESGGELHRVADSGSGLISAIHDAGYLTFLRSSHARWSTKQSAAAEIVPHVFATRYLRRLPSSVVAEAGRYMGGTNCPVGPDTWRSAYWSAQTAIAGAGALTEAARFAYSLCRPPGHHAHADMASGFCYLNNVAIAAAALKSTFPRLLILDVDVHHGNGTQEIFYEDGQIYTMSLHADPTDFFPFYSGYADEVGRGTGLGCNLNVPLPRGSGDKECGQALREMLTAARRFEPDAVIVALGFDGHEADPLGVFNMTKSGYEKIGEQIGSFGKPTLLVQEGGYNTQASAESLCAFLSGLINSIS
jgi:acetoin utilization deacetylase AcuC-like enzyme